MPPLQAKQHKIHNLRQFLNGDVPIAPIPIQMICQALFLEIPLRVDEPVMYYNLCVQSSDGDSLGIN
jgi:hypothetical protein